MKLALGIVLILCGSTAALVCGFMTVLLGGGSLAQTAEAPARLAQTAAASLVALWGAWLVRQHAAGKKRTPKPEP